MKTTMICKAIMLLMLCAFLNSCSKSGDNNVTPKANTGAFVANTTTYTGPCSSVQDVGSGGALGNIDVIIATTSGVGFFIYNMPQQSSGTYNFQDAGNTVGGSQLYGLFLLSSSSEFGTRSGTVTKTGTNSFTFSCSMYDLNSGQTISVTGKGSY